MPKSFLHGEKGSVAPLLGLFAVPLMLGAGVAVDYARISNTKAALQNAVDTAALATASELKIANTREEALTTVAERYVHTSLYNWGGSTNLNDTLRVKTTVSKDNSKVSVDVSYTWSPFLAQLFDPKATPVLASATASLAGKENICVLALDAHARGALAMTATASMTADNCAIYSNSGSGSGIDTYKTAKMNARTIYSSGGFSGPQSAYTPLPNVDSPAMEDPLIERPAPLQTACIKVPVKPVTLEPGTYCGGLTLKGKTDVMLKPGVYVIKDGPLSVQGDSTIKGENVGFYFTGKSATFDFGVSTQVDLSAPKSGPLSGILFFEDRSSEVGRRFVIRSKDAERFEGTVYLPKGKLVVDKGSRVGQRSKWTAIIARYVEVGKGPQIELKSDYANSDIPVPDGIGSSDAPRLIN